MPVSSPSYFPPNRANGTIVGVTAGTTTTGSRNFLAGKSAGAYLAESDVIVIGDSALSAGTSSAPLNDANIVNSVIFGNNAGKSLNTWGGLESGPSIIVGGGSWSSTATGSSMIVIGCAVYPNATHATGASGGNYIGGSVLIGHQIGQNTPAGSYIARESVMIGNAILSTSQNAPNNNPANNVLIGHAVAVNSTAEGGGVGFVGNVIIGHSAGSDANGNFDVIIGFGAGGTYPGTQANSAGAVCIGANTALGNSGAGNTLIGFGSSMSGASTNNTLLGAGCILAGRVGNTLLGDQTMNGGNFVWGTSGCTLIGRNAGVAADANSSYKLIIENNDGVTQRSLIYGEMGNGNLCVGDSRTGVNRDMPGTNVLKLIAGTQSGAPLGGGMFYVTGANNDVHWVGSDGVDTNLIAGAAGALAYTYNAPLTGFAITVANDIAQLVLEPAGTLATGTVTLPAAPEDGDTVGISTTQTITALTISPNAGQTVADAPTTLGVGGAVRFLYRSANTTWYRIGN